MRPKRYKKRPVEGRVMEKIAIIPFHSCWEWIGAKNDQGYGQFHKDGKTTYAHRWMYERDVGAIPDGLELDHLCKNPGCVRPSHLQPVTHQENVLRGKSLAAKCAKQCNCKNGHELTEENIYRRKGARSNERECGVCVKERNKKYWALKTYAVSALMLLSGCAVDISNFTACALVPNNGGAICDDFLQSDQKILTQEEWELKEADWNSQGQAVECTTSDAIGNIKAELEKLCSRYPCNESVKKSLESIERLQDLGTEALK